MTATTPPLTSPAEKSDPLALLTQSALVLLLATVAVRTTAGELVGDTFGVGLPAGPGPTTTILLNFLCTVPALLVLIRRAIDRAYVLRWHVSQVIVFALAAWITISAAWASNKSTALLGASTWWAAAAVLWAAGQLVRSWTRLRPVLGVAAALSMIFVVQAIVYRFVELPVLQHGWEANPEIVARLQADPNDFLVRQMARAIDGGQQAGFFRSPNSFAAIAVLAALVTAGFAGQRLMTRDGRGLAIALAVPVAVLPLIIAWTSSRTAAAAAALAAGGVALAWTFRDRLAARPGRAYVVGAGVVTLGVAAVVGIGLATGGLLQDSMNFRWHYWVAAARMFAQHPFVGVGWTNFGSHYLGVRLPMAAEEIKDPHNVFVRFATETGGVGLLLAVAWIGRALWEITRPVSPKVPTVAAAGAPWTRTVLWIVVLYWLGRTAVLWPLTAVYPDTLKTALFALLLAAGLLLCVVRTARDATPDDRPARFLIYATIAGLLAFLLHNQVDFALSDTGPLLLFALLLGGLLGLRHPGVAGKSPHTAAAIGGLAGVFVALLAAAGLWAVPTFVAEAKSSAADAKVAEAMDATKAGRVDVARGLNADAVTLYREAIANAPVRNPDYALRALHGMSGAPANDIIATYGQAIDADPADPQLWLSRARFGRQSQIPALAFLADYAQFVKLNPNDAVVRLEYAAALDAEGLTQRATEQYRAGLAANAGLDALEPRRLPAATVSDIEKRVGK